MKTVFVLVLYAIGQPYRMHFPSTCPGDPDTKIVCEGEIIRDVVTGIAPIPGYYNTYQDCVSAATDDLVAKSEIRPVEFECFRTGVME